MRERAIFGRLLAARQSTECRFTQKTVDRTRLGLANVIYKILIARAVRELFKFKNREISHLRANFWRPDDPPDRIKLKRPSKDLI